MNIMGIRSNPHGKCAEYMTDRSMAIDSVATVAAAAAAAAGGDAYCLEFNGSDERIRQVSISESSPWLTLTDTVSIGTWFKTTTSQIDAMWEVYKYNSRYIGMRISGSGNLAAKFRTNSAHITTASNTGGFNDDAWHLFVLVLTGGNLLYYIDNLALDRTVACAGVFNDTGKLMERFQAGQAATGGNRYTGRLASAFAVSAALSADDIAGLYNAGSVPDLTDAASWDTDGMEDNLIAWWRFGDGTDDITTPKVSDMSGIATPLHITDFTNMDDTNFIEDAPA